MKRIAYVITSSGEDGRAPKEIEKAFWHEHERDKAFDKDRNKAYLSKEDIIVDADKAKAEAMTKLDGLEKLVLGLVPPSGGALRETRAAK